LRIEVGHGHAAPFLIDMFVYRMIIPYCTKFDRLTNRKFMEIVGTRGQILMAKCTKIDFSQGSVPDPAGGAYDAPQTPSSDGEGIPPPHTLSPSAPMAPRPSRLRRSSRRLRRLDPSAPRSSRLRRSATSQRLKPTLLLPSGAATADGRAHHSGLSYFYPRDAMLVHILAYGYAVCVFVCHKSVFFGNG